MRMPVLLACSLAAALVLAGCSSVRSLTDARDAAGPPLGEAEASLVRGQVETALKEKRFADAWNQEIELGASRERFEAIAIAALEDDDGDAEDMFEQLRAKYGGLSEDARLRVDDLVRERMSEGRFELAAELAITAADDAPTYAHAFRVYEGTPARKAADVLQVIQEARAEAQADEGK
ncbi:MAG: hypothetical protein QNJ98_19735 [Planctomycetota bacterium]|nr:hypothetical protein [Planctomycetota bacterium]